MIASTASGESSSFFGEKASIEGGTTQILSSARPSQAYARRENT